MAEKAKGGRPPEKKFGPLHSGVSVAVWINAVESGDGPRRAMRSVTIAPRRYFDRETNQWKDAPSYSPADLPGLIYALQQALDFCFAQPLPGGAEEAEVEGEHPF